MEKYIICNFDETLYDGNLGLKFIKTMIGRRVLSDFASYKIQAQHSDRRKGIISEAVMISGIYNIYAKDHISQEVGANDMLARETWDKYGEVGMFGYAKSLLDSLAKSGFRALLLSDGSTEVVKYAGDYLGIDNKDIITSELVAKDGFYTGAIRNCLTTSGEKMQAIANHANDNEIKIDWRHSIGIVRDESGSGILRSVGLPFAFEPNDKLRAMATKKDWPIIDRNNALSVVKRALYEQEQFGL